ncbi:MAG: COG2426 family protein, partial [Eubacteriales bacterium]
KHRIFPRLVAWVQRKGQRGVEKLQAKQEKDLASDPASPDASHASEDGEVPEESAEPDAEKKREIRKQRGVTIGVLMGLFAFVAVPLPGTGAWTGSLIAALFGMKKRYAIPVIFAGVLVAGLVMTLASYGIVAALNFFVS